jgi:hypothetical protein
LLQTAQVVAFNPDNPSARMTLRLLFDNGSQRSYITGRAKEILSLKTLSKQTMSIVTFGSQSGNQRVCEVVRVGLQTRNPGLCKEFSMLTVPLIWEGLAATPVQHCIDKYSHIRQLDLADPPGCSDLANPDILIGSDHYWDLVSAEIIRGEGPIAIHTTLGWVLTGPITIVGGSKHSTSLVTHVLKVGTTQCTAKNLETQLRKF